MEYWFVLLMLWLIVSTLGSVESGRVTDRDLDPRFWFNAIDEEE